jgi:subtilisin-like proprotein convertase family protein
MKQKITLLLSLLCLTFLQAQTYSGATGIINDNGQNIDFTATVSGLTSNQLNASLGVVQVCLKITHTYDSDLNVFLIAPDGTTINLFSGIGGGNDNFTNTCLNQSASISINSGSAPFTGSFNPQESLGDCNNNQNGNGVWTLRIVDAAAQDEGYLVDWSITFGNNAAVPFVLTSSNLPIVIINTGGAPILDDPAINATMGIIYNGEGNVNTVLDTPNNYNGNISIEYRGAYSQSLPQKPFKIETIDANDLQQDVSILGMPEEHDWVLIANYNDKVFMRNKLAYQLFNDMGNYATRNQYCEVVINGRYQGIYLFMESIKRDNNRVDIAKLETTENSGINLTGGYIIKNDYWDNSNSWLLNYHPIDHPQLDVRLVYDYPKPDLITTEQQTYIQSYINDFETALYSPNFSDPVNGYSKYIDTDSFIDYFIVNELARNNDGFKKSRYFNKDKDSPTAISKLKAGPVWDFDWAWKNIPGCSIFDSTNGSGWAHRINDCGPDVNSPGWYVRLMQDPTFQNKLRCRWDNFRATILSIPSLSNFIDTNASYLNEAQSRHFVKWGNLGVNSGTPEIEADPATFEEQITKYKNWITTRIAWLDLNIPGIGNNCNLATQNLNKKLGISIYPNPAKEFFSIQSNDENLLFPIQIKVIDMQGRVLKVVDFIQENTVIYTNEFQKGTYCIQVESNDKKYLSKLIIE